MRGVAVLWLSLLLLNHPSIAETDTLHLSTLPGKIIAYEVSAIRMLETPRGQTPEAVAEGLFRPAVEFTGKSNPDVAYWATLFIVNDFDTDTTIYFQEYANAYNYLYRIEADDSYALIAANGYIVPGKLRNIKNNTTTIALRLQAGESVNLLLQMENVKGLPSNSSFIIFSESAFLSSTLATHSTIMTNTMIMNGFIWSVSCLFLFMLFAYFNNRQRIYLYYSAYLLCNVLYAIIRLEQNTIIGQWTANMPILRESLTSPILFLGFALYNLFVRELLDTKKYDPWIYKILYQLVFVYIGFAVLDFLLLYFFFTHSTWVILFVTSRIIIIPFNLFLMVRGFVTIKTPIIKYYVIGVSFFLFGGGIAAFLAYTGTSIGSVSPTNIFQIGILLEVLFFAFALGYRMRLTDNERHKYQEQYIQQLKVNHQLAQESNVLLEEKVQQRTVELLGYQKQLEEQKQKELQLEYEKKLSEIENVALRAQMNPHFLFNSLNAIKFFIISNENVQAANYLNRFSKLLRLILEHSKNELISLSDELESLYLYLEIESTRFDDSFSYQVNIAPEVITDLVMIPPLLLQPYVENAIWHGLLSKSAGEKLLRIDITQQEKGYLLTVEDNGVGRLNASKKKMKTHQSYGTQITQDRINLFNKNNDATIDVRIIDLPNHSGTRVEISYEL